VTKVGENSWILDALISFGWRAEVMARFDPATFDATKLLANGVDIWEKDVFTFPWRDGRDIRRSATFLRLGGHRRR
jgi:hypothetical protein